ncbi:MAG: V-type ATP synthase subunit F [Candidatus Geothermincolia bacterium]
MERNRIVVITDPVTAEGFKLTGIDVRSFVDPREARDQIRDAILDQATEIVLANDNFLDLADDSVKRHMKTSAPPVIIPLPIMRTKGHVASSSILSAIHNIDMMSGAAAPLETPEPEFEHHVTHLTLEARPCAVCGRMMEPGSRICANCGSIRRSVRARGAGGAPSRKSSCKTCGIEIPGNQTYCKVCLETQRRRAALAREQAQQPVKSSFFKRLVAAVKRTVRRIFGKGESG